MRACETILGPASHFPVRITLANGETHLIPDPFTASVNPYDGKFCFCPDDPYEFFRCISPTEIVAVEPIGRPIGLWTIEHWRVAEE
jgi:hypothetical protein